MPRLFIGIFPPASVGETLSLPEGPGIRPTRRDQLHTTLQFLGKVSEEEAGSLAARLSDVDIHPFEARLEGGGLFGSSRTRWIFWAGLHPAEPFVALHDRIRTALDAKPSNRPFTPHITLARGRKRTRIDTHYWRNTLASTRSAPFHVTGFDLVESVLSADGPDYRVRRSFGAD